jgi:hypothetical protein
MQTFNYDFDELPLVIFNGIEAGFINGAAEIKYGPDGDWLIGDLTVEGFGERVNGKRVWPQVPAPDELATLIVYRLWNEWRGKVQDAVNEQIAADLEAAADDYADMRRDYLMEDAR